MSVALDNLIRRFLALCPAPVSDALREVKYRHLGRKLERFGRKHRPRLVPESGPVPTLSIVVPCFNHSAFLDDAFHSLAGQTRKDFRLVLVDDRSGDDTLEKIQRNAAGIGCSSWEVLKNSRNVGQAASLNRAIEAAGTSHVMVFNDDDYLMLDAVETVLWLLGRYPHLHMLGSRFAHFDAAGASIADLPGDQRRISTRYRIRREDIDVEVLEPAAVCGAANPIKRYDVSHSGCTFTRSAWKAVGGYYPLARRFVSYTDRDFQLRVASCFPVGRVSDCTFSFWRTYSSVDNGVNS